jgi:hypothetical protein
MGRDDGCGCDERANAIERWSHGLLPVELQHLAVAVAIGVGGSLLALAVALLAQAVAMQWLVD